MQEGDTGRIGGHNKDAHYNYAREDLMGRVFVDFETFMKHVLHVPDHWRTRWGPAIEAIGADPGFQKHHKEYCRRCDNSASLEQTFSGPLMETVNAILDVLSRSDFHDMSSEIPRYHRFDDPKELQGGVINRAVLSPDLVALHKGCDSEKETLHWVDPLYVLEVRPFDSVIRDGTDAPKLVTDGKYTTDLSASGYG